MNDIKKAIEIATKAHKNQKDRAGKDYIHHPKTVASYVKNDKEKIVAWLHDVIEDTNITLKELSEYFTQDIIKAINIITKKKNQSYETYLINIKKNKLARNVKLADLKHNSNLKRLKNPSFVDIVRNQKYMKAIEYLK